MVLTKLKKFTDQTKTKKHLGFGEVQLCLKFLGCQHFDQTADPCRQTTMQFKLTFHVLKSIFILSNFPQTISFYSLGGPSSSRVCVLHAYHVHLEVWHSNIQGIPFWMGIWKINFQNLSLKVTCESFVFDALWKLNFECPTWCLTSVLGNWGTARSLHSPTWCLAVCRKVRQNKNPLGTLKHGTKIVAKVATKTLAKSAGKTNFTLSNPENRAKRRSK